MFIYCGSNANNISGGSGGGSGSTTINNYNSLYKNTINFKSYPFISNHCTLVSDPFTIVSDALKLNTFPGTVIFEFNEDIVFKSANIVNYAGANTLTLKNESNGIILNLNFILGNVTSNTLCRKVEFTLNLADILNLNFETPYAYDTKVFTSDTYFYNTYNALATGSGLISNLGNITIEFPEPTIIYKAYTTGQVFYYLDNTKVFEGDTNTPYINPINRIELDTDLTKLNYYSPKTTLTNGYILENILFNTYTPGYPNPKHYQFISSGQVNTTFTGTISFIEPTVITKVIATSISVDSKIHYTDINSPIKAQTLVVTGLSELSFYYTPYYTQKHTYETISFNSFEVGEINIQNEYFNIYSSDQLNNPAMINATKHCIYSSNSDAKNPLAGQGTINLVFKNETYLYSITTLGDATLSINNKTYAINGEVFLNDFINGSELCTSAQLTLLLTASLTQLKLYQAKTLSQTYTLYTEDFNTASYEFSSTTFDTNVASVYGTPNNSFAGPGIGSGGQIGPGQNTTYLGFATQSNLVFNESTYIESISFINSVYNAHIIADSNTIYLPNYGQNSLYTLSIKKNIANIQLNLAAVYSITYNIKAKREVISLLDNSITPTTLALPDLNGSFQFKIYSFETNGAVSYITLSKGNVNTTGTIYIQASYAITNESVFAQWLPNTQIQLYHNTVKIGGVGNPIYYVVFY